jgi:hypothetical protein
MFVKYIYIYIYEQYNPEMINQNTPKLKHFILIKKTNSYKNRIHNISFTPWRMILLGFSF